ncbi:NAD(P)-dependent dehydrogenase (short-subunit alcohol dehydrogenase family) [Tamaricihabitans halophyticus]|uniref:NAD(P)-dependent dehydrogenase (Short-subunit alcohol dehydrogenase family) n=1 Tax=Tamaricihabitans halophyticus TaxID=1262583 RepID=A0A4R2QV32_9PSEU|nr:SDR family oxidoreductase [Tamaricihabitans halophyticus]TCP50891.1 NAD(P)-dependent dehydrogenase (short-subunit alcohol dehydrogenase family) [Tamaricihabitans halophyticus]
MGEDPKGPRTAYRDLFRLHGRRTLVLGAGSGIGREAAHGLAAHGAEVVCADLDGDAAASTANAIGAGAEPYEIDLLEPGAAEQMASRYAETHAVVITAATNVRKRLADYTRDEFDRVLTLNLGATFEVIRAFGPRMEHNGGGSIIAFSSIRASTVEPGQGPYAASKAGLVQLLRTAAAEFGHAGVRANAIAPGVVETPLTAQIKSSPEWYQAYAAKSALGRWARPAEMVGAVVYLASDASSFVTGAVLAVDGGWTAVDGRFEPPAS